MEHKRIPAGAAAAGDSACLRDPLFNKGTAFTREERSRLAIDGLLPPRVESIEEQSQRVLAALRAKSTPLERYRYLGALQAENETLFYRVLLDHLEELLPVVYTPGVGEACLEWSRIYERPRGIYISARRHRGHIAEVLANWPRREVGIIVVTDGGRILGLGDLGANGMGISIGKLVLYTACAGVRPEQCLPVAIDVGTDNEPLRNDALYLGERDGRLTGDPWETLLEEFIEGARAVFPRAIVQFEDFNGACAFRLLDRYRERLCCFNDDVQGTGAMGLAGLYAAGRITGRRLSDQRVLFVGAGEACLGIGGTVLAAMRREGLSEADAKRRCLFVDSKGLVISSRKDLSEQKRRFAQERGPQPDLAKTVEEFEPTALVGACGQGGRFTQAVLEAMSRVNERPIVLALSNPTSKTECTAEQAYAWTGGRAVFAAGGQFPAVTLAGRVHSPGQGNNSYAFPGVGLGLMMSGSKRATDEMFLAAASALAAQVTDDDLRQGRIFPVAARMRQVARAVAVAVAGTAYDQGHATKPRPADPSAEVARLMYRPKYA